MRNTTRGGWKPIKHERILKPEVQKSENNFGVTDVDSKSALSNGAEQRKGAAGKMKDINI